jgi:predicted neutral ceramidase superfamily lipid hydrolase
MKYSQLIGVIASLGLIGACFLPWTYIESLQTGITGLNTAGTNYGRPGLMHMVIAGICTILFLIPTIWAKRVNVIIAAIGLAWALRNYLLVGTCSMGECPQKKIGLYLLLFFSIGMLLMSFLPRVPLNTKKED